MSQKRTSLMLIILIATLVIGSQSTRAEEKLRTDTSETAAATLQKPGPLEFQEVVQVDGATKDQLYSTALVWFGQTFGSGKEVLQIQDREGGTLVGRALFKYEPVVFMASTGIRGVVRYTVTLEFKDGRYRYTIGTFTHEGNPMNPGGQFSFGLLTNDEKCPYKITGPTASGREETWVDLKNKAQQEAETITKSLKAKMASAATQKKDW